MSDSPNPAGDRLDALVQAARDAQGRAYCPYSGFRVGAALLTADGEVFAGCNVENSSLGLTICAERAAAVAAVAAGHRRFVACAVATDADEPVLPCGACRQFLAELAPELPVVAVGRGEGRVETTIAELLPRSFRL